VCVVSVPPGVPPLCGHGVSGAAIFSAAQSKDAKQSQGEPEGRFAASFLFIRPQLASASFVTEHFLLLASRPIQTTMIISHNPLEEASHARTDDGFSIDVDVDTRSGA